MAVKAPNYTHLHPYLGEATPPRHLRSWQRGCRASFCSSAPVNSGCRPADPEPAAAFHLLSRSACFELRCHLYMHHRRFYPAGSRNLSHLTQPLQQLLKINRRATSPPARTPFHSRHMGSFSLSINYGGLSADGTASCCYFALNITH